jgi:hypothetical protein
MIKFVGSLPKGGLLRPDIFIIRFAPCWLSISLEEHLEK